MNNEQGWCFFEGLPGAERQQEVGYQNAVKDKIDNKGEICIIETI
ncbi:MAG: hypothetical protein WC875_01090 [Candidatus Absconditabacterales bacterium]